LNLWIWAHPAQAPDRAIRSNSSVRLRRPCGISASIPCASLQDTVSRQEAEPPLHDGQALSIKNRKGEEVLKERGLKKEKAWISYRNPCFLGDLQANIP
jgi:hypothetical protein